MLVHDEFRRHFFSLKTGQGLPVLVFYIGHDCMVHSPGRDGRLIEAVSVSDYVEKHPLVHDNKHLQIYCSNLIGYKRAAVHDGKRYQFF